MPTQRSNFSASAMFATIQSSARRRWRALPRAPEAASMYARSVLASNDPYHARVLRDLCDYVRREMTEPDGAFRSAQDAEVDAREGGSHVWPWCRS